MRGLLNSGPLKIPTDDGHGVDIHGWEEPREAAIYTYICMYVYTYIHTYMHACIHTYIHT